MKPSPSPSEVDSLRKEERRRWLLSNESIHFAGTAALAYQHYRLLPKQEDFSVWNKNYKEDFNNLQSEQEHARGQKLASYAEFLETRPSDGLTYEALSGDPEFTRLIRQLRDQGVQQKWEMTSFFAKYGKDHAKGVLGYTDYDKNSISKFFDSEQLQAIAQNQRPQIIDALSGVAEPLQGHHINSVNAELRADVTNVGALNDPNNIRLMTSHAHLNDPQYGHAGSFRNPTGGDLEPIEDTFTQIRKNAHDDVYKIDDTLKAAAGVSGAFMGTIAGFRKWRQLRNDPRPWHKRAALTMSAASLGIAQGSITAYAAMYTRAEVGMFMPEEMATVELGDYFTFDSFGDILGATSSIGTVALLNSGFKAISTYSSSRDMKSAAAVFRDGAFDAGKSAAMNLALGLVADAFLPDPTGVVIAVRLAYAGGKMALNHRANIDCQRRVTNVRVAGLHDIALKQLGY